jgi:RNA recognition motif-containing protein
MALFTEYGSVSKINMPIDRETGRPRGFAFVNMSNAQEHAAAIAALNESEVGGRTIYVSESVPKEKYAANKKDKYDATRKPRTERRGPRGTKIYVGNLSFDTTMEDVQAAFSEFGEVKDCFVPLDYDGNPRGFAFVTLDDDNALAAIEGMDGVELGGRTLNVKKSLPKESKPRDRY